LQVVGLANEEPAAFKKAGRLLSGQEADELFSEPPAATREPSHGGTRKKFKETQTNSDNICK